MKTRKIVGILGIPTVDDENDSVIALYKDYKDVIIQRDCIPFLISPISTIDYTKEEIKNIKALTEKEIIVKYEEPIPIIFKGYLDKILYEIKDDKTYVAIIDYKTGDVEVDVNKIKFGLSMQLQIYLYLLKHAASFKNVVVCGFYIQKIMPKQLSYGDDYLKYLSDSIALQGYSNSSFEILSHFDPAFSNSTMIKGMKLTAKQEFNRFSKVLSTKQMDEITIQVEELIKNALINITNCNFTINPKILNNNI